MAVAKKGKKGENVKKLRKDHPNTSIDVRDTVCFIHSEDISQRNSVVALVKKIVDCSKCIIMEYSADDLITLKSAKGAELLKSIRNDLKVEVKLETENESVTLRGKDEGDTHTYIHTYIHTYLPLRSQPEIVFFV